MGIELHLGSVTGDDTWGKGEGGRGGEVGNDVGRIGVGIMIV